MTNSTTDTIQFTSCKRRKVEAQFGGGEISSEAGAMLLSEADKMIGLCDRVASIVDDPRIKNKGLSLDDLSREERQSIESACSSAKYVQGPAAYIQCIKG